MTLLGLSSSLDKNDSALVAIVHGQKGLCLGCHRPWTKMTLLGLSSSPKMTLRGLSSSMDKNDSAWVVIVPGQK